MPTSEGELLMAGEGRSYRFDAEPAHNAIYSLLLLNKVEHLSGLDGWLSQLAARLTPERLYQNRVVMEGLHFAVVPERSFASFLGYLSHLGQRDPWELRDQIARNLWPALRPSPRPDAPPPPANPQAILASQEAYLDFIRFHFAGKGDLELEAEAYELIADPPRMREVIVGHLRDMWNSGLAAEWERARPLVQESVQAFRKIDMRRMSPDEAARTVIDQEPNEKLARQLQLARTITFVPSPHLGPYVSAFCTADQARLWILFGARLPAGVEAPDSLLTRSELLVRLGALTDDARLRVLDLLAHEDELCAPDLVARLDLSQPAVSRHLRQLVAAGYVHERWRDGSKCYRLNRARIGDTLRALERFFG